MILRDVGVVVLILLGLCLRGLGLLFNGTHDVAQIVLVWGVAVRDEGLGPGYAGVYGVLSYALFGVAAQLGEVAPRFWWAPYKLLEIASEAGILLFLMLALPRPWRFWAIPLFWLNPWFILHGAWLGFWDGPHSFLGLVAVVVLQRVPSQHAAWALCGAAVMASALVKPQGLAYFVLPLGLYVTLFALASRNVVPLVTYTAGVVGVFLTGSAALGITGGDPLEQGASYAAAAATMPALCNNCVGVWRPVTSVLQAWLGQEGPAYALVLPTSLDTWLSVGGLVASYGLVVVCAIRLGVAR